MAELGRLDKLKRTCSIPRIVETCSTDHAKQESPNRPFDTAPNPVAASRPTPSEITAKTTTKIIPKSVQRAPENRHKGADLFNIQNPETDQGAEGVEVKPEISKGQDPQNQDQEIGSQGKTEIVMKVNIPPVENDYQNYLTPEF